MPPVPRRWSRSTSRPGRSSRRRADLAIAGGVYLEADVDFPLVFRQLNALSRSGTARPFAASADGMMPGEGVGVVVLKRRADAERDGDRIYAVIQGVGLASDGKSQGLAAPSARGHARAMRRAYRQAGIDPATVMLVEGHGLGVPAADRAELRALNAVFPRLASWQADARGRLVDDRPRHAGRRHGRIDQDGAGALPPRLAADLARRQAAPAARSDPTAPSPSIRQPAPGFTPT